MHSGGKSVSGQLLDDLIREAELLCGEIEFLSERFGHETLLKAHEVSQLREEPLVNHCDRVDLIDACAASESLVDDEYSLVVDIVKPFRDLLVGEGAVFLV